MLKAILFDMDGLLVETEDLAIEVATKLLSEMNINLTPEEQQTYIGTSDKKFYGDLFIKKGLDYDLDDILRKHFDIYDNLLENHLKPFVGADSLPRELKNKGYMLALVSGSTRKQIEIILNKLNIAECFNLIISAEDVVKGKPNPDCYLLAINKLNVTPDECVVLEDSINGIKAGKSAGVKVIGVVNNGKQDLSLADIVVKNLTEINL